jgi:hypothetical protein
MAILLHWKSRIYPFWTALAMAKNKQGKLLSKKSGERNGLWHVRKQGQCESINRR